MQDHLVLSSVSENSFPHSKGHSLQTVPCDSQVLSFSKDKVPILKVGLVTKQLNI